MSSDWRRPTAIEAARGIIAVLLCRESVFIRGANVPYCHDLPYTTQMLERRIARGGALPYWITVAKVTHKERERV